MGATGVDHAKMLRVSSAASGEELLSLDAAEFDAMVAVYGSTGGSLKRHLAERHFKKRYSRFQLRFLREGAPDELQDDENITPPMDLQLMLMNHLPPDEDRDRLFLNHCQDGRVEEVEQSLRGLQNPSAFDDMGSALWYGSVARPSGFSRLLAAGGEMESKTGSGALHHAALLGRLEMVARLKAMDFRGHRALHWAGERGHTRSSQGGASRRRAADRPDGHHGDETP